MGKMKIARHKFINSSISHYVIQRRDSGAPTHCLRKEVYSRLLSSSTSSNLSRYAVNVELEMIMYLLNSTMLFYFLIFFDTLKLKALWERYNIDDERFFVKYDCRAKARTYLSTLSSFIVLKELF